MANYRPAPQGRSNGAVTGALKPGEYPATVIQVQVKISKCGNYEQHALRVRVEDTANDHWEDFWERLTFSDTAMWKVVAAAIESKAEYFVSGDKDIISLVPLHEIKVVTPREFWEVISKIRPI